MRPRIAIRTLVIDDEETVCRRIRTWLEEDDYEVEAFTDARAGIERVRAAPQNKLRLALVDLRLPDMDGAAVIREIVSLAPRMRVLAMSAFPENDGVAGALSAGARELLVKPVQRVALLDTLERHLAEMGVPGRTEAAFNRRLGARLRALRGRTGRKLIDVAQASGITPAQLSQIELGRNGVSTWTLVRICNALETPLPELFRDL